MINSLIKLSPIQLNEIDRLIDFDNLYLRNSMKEQDIPDQQLPPILTTQELKEGIYKIEFPRTTTMNGYSIGGAMDVNSWISFSGNNDKATRDPASLIAHLAARNEHNSKIFHDFPSHDQ